MLEKATASTASCQTQDSVEGAAGFPRFIGEMMVQGYSLVSGTALARLGDEVTFERICQKIANPRRITTLSLLSSSDYSL